MAWSPVRASFSVPWGATGRGLWSRSNFLILWGVCVDCYLGSSRQGRGGCEAPPGLVLAALSLLPPPSPLKPLESELELHSWVPSSPPGLGTFLSSHGCGRGWLSPTPADVLGLWEKARSGRAGVRVLTHGARRRVAHRPGARGGP
jgi:hypothetical protein